jgi:hypothetical protein
MTVPRGGQPIVVEQRAGGEYQESLLAANHWLPFTVIAPLKVSKAARVLRPGQVTAVTGAPSGTQTITFARGVRAPAAGTILVVGVSAVTPDGLLRRVTASAPGSGGTTTVTTVPATLSQAVSNASISVSADLSAADKAPSTAGGARRALSLAQVAPRGPGVASSPLGQAISKNFSCSASATAALTGSLSISPSFQLTAQLGLTGLQSASFTGTVTEDAELSASVSAAASCTLASTPLLPKPIVFDPITFTIGPIPVVIVPELQFYISASGKVAAQLTATAGQQATATAGLSWAAGTLSPVSGISNTFSFSTTPPAQQLTGNLTASAGPDLSLLLYGVAGSKLAAAASVTLQVAPADTPSWKLTAGFDAGASLVFPALDIDKSDDDILHFERLLAPQPYLYFEHCTDQAKGCLNGTIDRTTIGSGHVQVLHTLTGTLGVGFAVSPDDRYLVYPQAVSDGDQLLFVQDIATGKTRQLTSVDQPCPQYDDSPSWSPNNQWITFQRGTFGDICPAKDSPSDYRISVNGTGLLRLSPDLGAGAVAWNASSSRIAGADADLITADPNGTHEAVLVRTTGDEILNGVNWSRSGLIAYTYFDTDTGLQQLRTISAAGGKSTTICQATSKRLAYFANLSWSPDSSTIYFDDLDFTIPGSEQIFSVTATPGSHPVEVTALSADDEYPIIQY